VVLVRRPSEKPYRVRNNPIRMAYLSLTTGYRRVVPAAAVGRACLEWLVRRPSEKPYRCSEKPYLCGRNRAIQSMSAGPLAVLVLVQGSWSRERERERQRDRETERQRECVRRAAAAVLRISCRAPCPSACAASTLAQPRPSSWWPTCSGPRCCARGRSPGQHFSPATPAPRSLG